MPGLIGRARREGVARVRMLTILTASFLVFWSPLFLVTLASWGGSWEQDQSSIAHEVITLDYIDATLTLLYLR